MLVNCLHITYIDCINRNSSKKGVYSVHIKSNKSNTQVECDAENPESILEAYHP